MIRKPHNKCLLDHSSIRERRNKCGTERQFTFVNQIKLTLLVLIAMTIVRCSGGGGDNSSAGPDIVRQGVFLDSAVEGLHFQTDTQSGITDTNGTFRYMGGEMIMFSMGDIVLGEAMAEEMMTPIDLVPGAADETHPMVTNMIRFMQTLDEDSNLENGITLTEDMMGELSGRNIRFDMDPDQFEHDPDVEMFMDTINAMDGSGNMRMMVSIEDAREHMRTTMMEMMGYGPR